MFAGIRFRMGLKNYSYSACWKIFNRRPRKDTTDHVKRSAHERNLSESPQKKLESWMQGPWKKAIRDSCSYKKLFQVTRQEEDIALSEQKKNACPNTPKTSQYYRRT